MISGGPASGGDLHLGGGGQGMPAGQHRDQRFLAQRHGHQVVRQQCGRTEDGQVELRRAQRVEQGRREQLPVQVQLEVRQLGPHALRDAGEHVVGRRADEAHADPAGPARGEQSEIGGGAVQGRQDLAGAVLQQPARLGELDPTRGPVHQPDADLVLELPQVLRQRRLGDVQPGGGAAEVAFLGEHGERPEVAQLHGVSLCAGLMNDGRIAIGRDG